MTEITIHPSARKRGYTDDQIVDAWVSGFGRRCWLDHRDVPRELRIGFDRNGVEYELVGLVFGHDRVLVHHCKTPPTKAARLMIDEVSRWTR